MINPTPDASRIRHRDQYRLVVSSSDEALAQIEPQIPADLSEVEDAVLLELCRHCVKFIDLTATFLTLVAGHTVSLSVKFLWLREHSEPVLHTLFRNTTTRREREAYAPRNDHNYRENTAFQLLLEEWPVRTEYASNDLLLEYALGRYTNSNRRWYCFYTTTAVVPIPCVDGDNNFPIGFVCADSLGGELNNTVILSMLQLASKHLYNVLGALFSRRNGDSVWEGDLAPPDQNMPCGWKYDDGRLSSSDLASQMLFQQILEQIDDIYRSKSEFTGEVPEPSPKSSANEHVPPHIEEIEMDSDVELFPGYDELLRLQAKNRDDGHAKLWLEMREDHPAPTRADADEILERMAVYNPDAARILQRRRMR